MKAKIETIIAVAMIQQLFAEGGGVVVNTTTGYVNSYTGAAVTPSPSTNTMNPTLKEFYDTELLENARMEMVYAQFAKREPLPAHHKGQVQFRKWNTFGNAVQLQEGVIPTGQQFGMTYITAEIAQYGTYTTISDRLETEAYDDVILGATEEMGASAAQTQETLTRTALLTGTNVLYCDNIKNGDYVSTPTSCATMGAGGGTGGADGWSTLTPKMVNKAATIMKKMKAPKLPDGKYGAVIHPSVAYDLRESPEWIDVQKYMNATTIYNGEIGELHGVRFVEDPDAPVLGGNTYKNKSNGVTYATFFFGKDGFVIIDPEGGNLEMIVHDKNEGGTGGPLNQWSTIGYKFESNGATILYPERVLRVMSCSTFSAEDDVN